MAMAAPAHVTVIEAPPPTNPCEALRATERATIAALGDDGETIHQALATFGRCLRTPDNGAWAVVVDDVAPAPREDGYGGSFAGHWSVVRVSPDGTVARLQRAAEWVVYSHLHITHTALADYDHDGTPELVLASMVAVSEGASSFDGEVLTLRGGAIVPYEPAVGLRPDEARDVDGDGLPDLVSFAPYTGEGDDSPSGFSYDMRGPPLLAHALADGTFARNDAVAKRFARTQCPARNPRVFDTIGDHAAQDVVCARIWGVPAAAVRRAITTRCASVAERSAHRGVRPPCGDVRELTRWASLAPTVTLP